MLDVVGAGLLGRITDDACRALKRTWGLPWVSTIAADSRGDSPSRRSRCSRTSPTSSRTGVLNKIEVRWTPLTSRFCPGEIAKASGLEVVELNGG